MTCNVSNMDDLEAEVVEADERARAGRIARLEWLQLGASRQYYPVPALAREYFLEARLCWYVGAFISTILMVQLAFEEFLRSQYRVARGVGGKLDSGTSVDSAGFAELIEQERNDDFLSKSEADDLTALRKSRNPYVHAKDVGGKGTSFFELTIGISAPESVGVGVEDEARNAIKLLTTFFPALCLRM